MPDLWATDELPGLHWDDVPDAKPARKPGPQAAERLDLRAYGLTPRQIRAMTTIKLNGSYL